MEEAIIQRQNKETESIEPTFTQQPTAKHSGRRMSRWRPRARWLLVTLCIATVGGRLLAAESSMSAITQLTNYLASPRWLSELEVDLSLGHFYTKDQPKNRPEFSTWRASLQPEGYFFQCVSNSPYTSTLIFGESIDTYWQTSLAGVAVASKKKEEGGSEKNSRQAVSNVFLQLNGTLEQLSADQYIQPCRTLFNNTIGQHVRHIIELYQSLQKGYGEGVINYEKRKRDVEIEKNKALAGRLFKEIFEGLDKANKDLQLEAMYDDPTGNTFYIATNYYREIAYNLEHTIHHMALIRIGINEVSSVFLSEEFGVASSTLKYRGQCAQ